MAFLSISLEQRYIITHIREIRIRTLPYALVNIYMVDYRVYVLPQGREASPKLRVVLANIRENIASIPPYWGTAVESCNRSRNIQN